MVDEPPELLASASKPASTFERAGDRLRLAVELRPGETTIVSWRKLVREATSKKSNVPDPSASCSNPEVNQLLLPLPPPQPPPPLSIVATANEKEKPDDSEAPPGSNRLSNVIEKIERLYAGNGSSDDEDVVLDDVPDDDEYDTEDSFIDDAELDDYFKVDKSTTKHDGFFVNRGKLERIEPTASVEQLPKKRRRKDGTRDQGGDDRHNSIKQMKMGTKSRKALSSAERNSISQLPSVVASNASGISGKNKSIDAETITVPLGHSNIAGSRQDKVDDHQGNEGPSSLKHNNKQKESGERDALSQRSIDRSVHGSNPDTGKQLINVDEEDQTIQRIQKRGLAERFDLNVPATRDLTQMKTTPVARKDGSNVRPRITMLEKAIRELEKTVAESRPPSTEMQDADNISLQGIKRRLPADIKQKLAKVARLAHDSNKKIPKDVISRLMSIVGHFMSLRTLKRNLRVMTNLGLSAKKEKDDRLQKIKLEIVEMVKERISYIESKVVQQKMNSNDFQETNQEENEASKRKYSMDEGLENKICDLYDLYIERMEEHSGPPVKRMYEELAALWPNGVMDVEGIKRAIYKAKNRRKALASRRKDQSKIKKGLGAKVEGSSVRGEAFPLSRTYEKLMSESSDGASPYTKSTVLAVPAQSLPAARFPSDTNRHKDERIKGSSSSINPTEALPMKKVKRKPNPETTEAQPLPSIEESKQQKHMAMVPVPKPTDQLNASEDPS